MKTVPTVSQKTSLALALAVACIVSPVCTAQSLEPVAVAMDAAQAKDVTDAAIGKQMINEAVARWDGNYRLSFNTGDLKVYEVAKGDYLVWPANEPLPKLITAFNKFTGEFTMGYEDADEDVLAKREDQNAVDLQPENFNDAISTREGFNKAAPYWSQTHSNCYARVNHTFGWMDTCFRQHKLINDGNSTRDYFQFEQYGTAQTKTSGFLQTFYLGGQKTATSVVMAWEDWSPRSNTSGNCSSGYNIGFSLFGASIGRTFNRCDNMYITKGTNGGYFSHEWKGGGYNINRENAYMIGVSVAQGKIPYLQTTRRITGVCHC